jgi:hypothetical protein
VSAGPGGVRFDVDMGVGGRGRTRTCQNTETILIQVWDRIQGGRIAKHKGGLERAGEIEAVAPARLGVPCAGVRGSNR